MTNNKDHLQIYANNLFDNKRRRLICRQHLDISKEKAIETK